MPDGSGLLNRSFWLNVTEAFDIPGYFTLGWSVEATELSCVLGYSFAKRNSDEIAPTRRGRQVTFCTAKSTTCLTNTANIFGNPKPGFFIKFRLSVERNIWCYIRRWNRRSEVSMTLGYCNWTTIVRQSRIIEIIGYSNWAITDYITEVFKHLHICIIRYCDI